MSQSTGNVSKVIGPVVDVSFDTATTTLPNIYDSLEIQKTDGSMLVLEVQSNIGEDQVRAISMDSTDGLERGAKWWLLETLSKCRFAKMYTDVYLT